MSTENKNIQSSFHTHLSGYLSVGEIVTKTFDRLGKDVAPKALESAIQAGKLSCVIGMDSKPHYPEAQFNEWLESQVPQEKKDVEAKAAEEQNRKEFKERVRMMTGLDKSENSEY